MGYLILTILIVFSFWLIHKNQFNTGLSRNQLWLAWALKISFGTIFILIFTYYYGGGKLYGDVGNFYRDSAVLAEYGKQDFWGFLKLIFGVGSNDAELLQTHLADTRIWSYGDNGDLINDNRLILKINALLHFISFSNIYVHALIFSFLSFIGIIHIYKAFKKYVKNPIHFFFGLIIFPSIAFWSGGISKETIMILSIGLFLYHFFKILDRNQAPINYFLLLISLALLLFNKPYTGLILIPLALIPISGLVFEFRKKALLIWPIIIVLAAIALSYGPPSLNLVDKTSYKQRDLINIGKGGVFFITDSSFCAFDHKYLQHFQDNRIDSIKVLKTTPGEYKLFGENEFHPFTIEPSDKNYAWYLTMRPSNSYVDVTPIDYSGIQLVKNMPESLLNTTIRPFPTDPGSSLKYLVFVQNIILLGWLIFSIIKRRKLEGKESYLIFYLLTAALIILLLIGWTTPILGAVARYKTGAELLIIIASFILLKELKPIRK